MIYMKKIMKLLLSILIFTLSFIILIRINESHYESKFDKTKINLHLSTIKSNWGSPNDEFQYENTNKYIVKYKKGILGWNTYIFIFNTSDSLLIEKHIDD